MLVFPAQEYTVSFQVCGTSVQFSAFLLDSLTYFIILKNYCHWEQNLFFPLASSNWLMMEYGKAISVYPAELEKQPAYSLTKSNEPQHFSQLQHLPTFSQSHFTCFLPPPLVHLCACVPSIYLPEPCQTNPRHDILLTDTLGSVSWVF